MTFLSQNSPFITFLVSDQNFRFTTEITELTVIQL